MRSIPELWRSVPLKAFCGVTLACLLLGERYPFSDFPMFGSFGEKSYYVYLADQNGQAIPAAIFGVETNGIKKSYERGLSDAKAGLPKKTKISAAQDRRAAERTLLYLVARTKTPPPELSALRLIRVDLRFTPAGVQKTTRLAAEVPLR